MDKFPLRRVEPGDVDPALAGALDWRRLRAVPLRTGNGARAVAVADPTDLPTLDAIRRALGHDVQIYRAHPDDLDLTLSASGLLAGDFAIEQDTHAAEDLAERAAEAPIVNLVNAIIRSALAERASDVHVEALPEGARVMLRIDGLKVPTMNISKTDLLGVTSRIKVMAGMDIAERRLPQDGRIRARDASGELVDIRVSTIPSAFGECVCMRLLRRTPEVHEIDALGMSSRDRAVVEAAIRASWGMILASGPTGSGKSTTLAALIRRIASPAIEILTIEDPVEYHIPEAHQVQINEKAGLTFASALRAFLRHDPDVIMVGEIRDQETAEIATRAAMTGHLVLSTVHTNDAPSVPVRLIDMGVEPFLVASSLTTVIAQRLVRKTCPECGRPARVPPDAAAVLGEQCPPTQMQGAGCAACRGTGYRGRTGIFQVMRVTPEIRALISRGADADTIAKAAARDGTVTLLEDGLRLVREGVTTVQEVMRVATSGVNGGEPR